MTKPCPSGGAGGPDRGRAAPPPNRRAAGRTSRRSPPASSRSAPTGSTPTADGRPAGAVAQGVRAAATSWRPPTAGCSSARTSTSACGASRWPAATARSTCSCASCARSSSRSRRRGDTCTPISASATGSPPSRSTDAGRRGRAGCGAADGGPAIETAQRADGGVRCWCDAAPSSTSATSRSCSRSAAIVAVVPGGGTGADVVLQAVSVIVPGRAGVGRGDLRTASTGPTLYWRSATRRRALLYGALAALAVTLTATDAAVGTRAPARWPGCVAASARRRLLRRAASVRRGRCARY